MELGATLFLATDLISFVEWGAFYGLSSFSEQSLTKDRSHVVLAATYLHLGGHTFQRTLSSLIMCCNFLNLWDSVGVMSGSMRLLEAP
jgi:hypothetical protein